MKHLLTDSIQLAGYEVDKHNVQYLCVVSSQRYRTANELISLVRNDYPAGDPSADLVQNQLYNRDACAPAEVQAESLIHALTHQQRPVG